MSNETLREPQPLVAFEVTDKQRESLTAEDQICLILATDGIMMQFSQDPSSVNNRLMDLTGLDREHLVNANRSLVGGGDQRAKLVQLEKDEDNGVRLSLTHAGKQHLEDRIKSFSELAE